MTHHLANTLAFRPIVFTGGAGSHLISAEGNHYLDFFCDVGTASLGYNSLNAKNALQDMLDFNIPIHSPNLFQSDIRNRVARKLAHACSMDKVFFCNSGTEAAEAAIKAARKYFHDRGSPRRVIATAVGGFHGRTGFSLAAGDGPPHHRDGFEPLPLGFKKIIEPNMDIDSLPKDLAAVMLAPVFGNNDVWEYEKSFLQDLRKWCDKTGTLLIFDEVQSGSGRTGSTTYSKKINVWPDILCLAKGIAMGAPVGATLFRGDVANTFTPGSHFSTFGGNPFSCIMVEAMLLWLENHQSVVDQKGAYIKSEIERGVMGASNVRGPGMLMGFDTELDCLDLARVCEKKGLLIGAFRPGPGPVKITPPLNITPIDIDLGLKILSEAANEIYDRVGPR